MSKTVLVVDDSATVRKFVAASLSLKGFRVITAADGMEALEKMPQEKFDLVITDLNMPDMDGFEFIKNLRETPEYAGIPIIILSSIVDQEEKDRGLQLGAYSYIEKPFSVEKVQREVARFLN
ncbi:MAG TPA: response regulator [Bacteroidetes bacterium]|nr:response regulator [Bacteroidota bacterium]